MLTRGPVLHAYYRLHARIEGLAQGATCMQKKLPVLQTVLCAKMRRL